jgi:dephospho-CoA kinase
MVLKDAFKNDFILIHVYITDPEVRYQRMQKRGSQRDNMTYIDFLKQDRVSEDLFRIHETIKMADFSISNDGTLEDMHRQIDKMVQNGQLPGCSNTSVEN